MTTPTGVKAQELMIGNYLQGNPLSIPRMNISSDGVMQMTAYGIYMIEIGSLKLEPIPLTEQWLKEFGFIIQKSFNDKEIRGWRGDLDYLKDYGSQEIVIRYNENSKKWNAVFEFGYYANQIDCDYVHQLQNLYFALTATSLTRTEDERK